MMQKLKPGEKKPTTKYKGIYCHIVEGMYVLWNTRLIVKGKLSYSNHQTEIAAAKRYDMYLIRAGREPVNILKRKL